MAAQSQDSLAVSLTHFGGFLDSWIAPLFRMTQGERPALTMIVLAGRKSKIG